MTHLRESLVSDKPPLTSLLLIITVAIIGFGVIGPMLGFSIAALFFDGTIIELKHQIESSQPDKSSFIPFIILQGVASATALMLLPALYIRFAQRKSLGAFVKNENQFVLKVLVICLLGITTILSISPIAEWNMNVHFPDWLKGFDDWARGLEDRGIVMTRFMTDFDSPFQFALGILIIAVIPAIGEEFVFRGLIQHELWRSTRNVHIAIWASAILFSTFHLQFFGFVPRMLLGALFGYLYYWSGNLWIPIIGHLFNNAFLLTMVYLNNEGVTQVNMDDNTSIPIYLTVVCVVITFALLYFFRKQYLTPQEKL